MEPPLQAWYAEKITSQVSARGTGAVNSQERHAVKKADEDEKRIIVVFVPPRWAGMSSQRARLMCTLSVFSGLDLDQWIGFWVDATNGLFI